MVQLELLDSKNEKHLLEIDRKDIPINYVEEIASTIALAKYGEKNGLKGHCFAIKYNESYVGIILIGEAIEEEADPEEVKGKEYFRILGFVIDRRYQNMGLGSIALHMAMKTIWDEYGKVVFLLECYKENQKAIHFYEKNGFVNTNILNQKGTDYFFIMRGADAK